MAPAIVREDDFIFTLSDREENFDDEESLTETPPPAKKRKRDEKPMKNGKSAKRQKKPQKAEIDEDESDSGVVGEHDGAIDPDFEFEVGGQTGVIEDFDGWDVSARHGTQAKIGDKKAVDVDDIIQRRREKKQAINGLEGKAAKVPEVDLVNGGDAIEEDGPSELGDDADDGFEGFDNDELLAPDGFGMGAAMEDEDPASDRNEEDEDEESQSGDSSAASPVPHPDDIASEASSEDEVEDPDEKAKRDAFFAPEDKTTKQNSDSSNRSFQNFSLSRPILRGVAAIGFTAPTPIQQKTIPVALLGKDVVGGAVTGSGKTAAFIIPILERLLYRPRKNPLSRVVILMPTRELAVQCYNVATKLASFTDITFGQAIGGLNSREQENVLKKRPDVIIATPGRFIDHMRNSASFAVDTLEILVLDEADRMLETGFADELNEILTTIPKSRQTMLFSATMTDSVDKLIRVGLNRPVRLLVDAKNQTVGSLVQEFVRLRPGREDKRLGYLMLLCKDVYTDRVIIFFRQKKEAHRVRIIFGLLGLKAAELHGSMSQDQRIKSVENFRDGKASFLLATDVASRGLDIKGVETVINYEAPQSHEVYLHRVGRTARAGRTGRSCTIAAEPDRRVVKAAVKAGRAQGAKIVGRVIEAADADKWATKVDDLQNEVEEILKEEKEERQLAQTEMQLTRGENIMTHQDDIMARPKRTWFESERDKQAAKKLSKAEVNGGLPAKKEKQKLSNKEKKRLDDTRERKEGKQWRKGKDDARNVDRAKVKKGRKDGKKDSKKGKRR